MSKIKVASLTGSRTLPSSRFRVRQHVDRLATHGIQISDFPQPFGAEILLSKLGLGQRLRDVPKYWHKALLLESRQFMFILQKVCASYFYDVIWLSREMYPGRLTGERFLKKPMVFDVDDAIWLNKPGGKELCMATAKRSEVIIAGNEFIADWFSSYNKNVLVIPTAVDTVLYKKCEKNESRFTIGWIGTSSNFESLRLILNPLKSFFQLFPDARFLIVSDKNPNFDLLPINLEFIPWSEEAEVSLINSFDIGVKPLKNDEWSRGKCSFKMLQYMACEVPCVVSPVGMNLDIIKQFDCALAAQSEQDWLSALIALYQDAMLRKSLAQKSRHVIEQNYSSEHISKLLSGVFHKLI